MTEEWARPDISFLHSALLDNVKLVHSATQRDAVHMQYCLRKVRENLISLDLVLADVLGRLHAQGVK